jgi:hypothetical protein
MPYFDNRPYPILIIRSLRRTRRRGDAVGVTNAPTSMDVTKKGVSKPSSSACPPSDEKKNERRKG